MDNPVLTIILAIFGCGAFWSFVQFLITRFDGKHKAMTELQNAVAKLQKSVDGIDGKLSLQDEALMSIAQDRIIWLGKEFIKQGWIAMDDLKNLRRMANAYKALGGNDLVKIVMDEVDKLERR